MRSSGCRCSSTIRLTARQSFGSCCSLDDLHDARRVAAAINIPHYILNLERQFDEQVVSNFVARVRRGPDAAPLRALQQRPEVRGAREPRARIRRRRRGDRPLRAESIATTSTDRYRLKRGVDPAKDQSYFLFSLTQDQLARAVFPVGDRGKDAVRAYARARRLPVADKPDSQEICFVPDHDYAALRRKAVAGHRRGRAPSSTSRAECSARTPASTDSPSGSGRGSACRLRDRRARLRAGASRRRSARSSWDRRRRSSGRPSPCRGVNWIEPEPAASIRASVQIRHRHPAAPATVRVARRRPRGGRRSTRRRLPSRRDRPPSSTMASSSSAVGGSTRGSRGCKGCKSGSVQQGCKRFGSRISTRSILSNA